MLSAPVFSDRTFDFLADDLSAVDWILEHERLEKSQRDVERELCDTRVGRKPSNAEILGAILDVLVPGFRVQDEERRKQFAVIVNGIEDALAHDHLARRMKLEKLGPPLIELYRYYDKGQLAEDLAALSRPDDSKETDAKIAALERKIEQIKRKIEGHKGNILKCFRGGELPKPSLIHAIAAHLDTGWPAERIAELLLKKFASDYRTRAPLFEKPVSIHGTLINSMEPKRRDAWQKAYDKMKLGELPKNVRYAPRMEPRPEVVSAQPKGEFFLVKDNGREAVSTR